MSIYKTIVFSLVTAFLLLFFSHDILATNEATSEATSRARVEVRKQINENREEAIQLREEAQTLRTQKREELQKQLSEITDKRKVAIVESLTDKLASLNSNWVARWSRVLTRLSELLTKIETRTNTLADKGYDVAAVRTAITEAKDSIAIAQSALDKQELKVYTFDISEEEALRDEVGEVVSQFRADLKALQELVKDARESVRDALAALKKVFVERMNDES